MLITALDKGLFEEDTRTGFVSNGAKGGYKAMFTTDAVIKSGFQHLKQMDWDPALSGFEGWGSEVPQPVRWCVGLPSWVPTFAQPNHGSEFWVGPGRIVKLKLVCEEKYPRFSGNPARSLSPQSLELAGIEVSEEREESLEGDEEDEGRGLQDSEFPEECFNVAELLPKYYRDNHPLTS